ncbi:glycosyl hydrolase-like protein family 88 [Corynespora cassiicola Philippines]|uniref:Glycosyl hydrolase-like protein family 88 n=1 Tax=Corynespora cassiicola Philippines TaxID=1448308 RepID=A0A2T2P4Z7_CORCC|nr:glycosyl hydrolase-like protein family 88 [Corynespora cassiicola Philippines]
MHYPALSLALLTCAGTSLAAPYARAVNETKPYSTWMATSFLSKGQKINRHYVPNVVNEGVYKAAALHKDDFLFSYASDQISSLIAENGTIIGWNSTYYSVDDLRVGNNILYFWDAEGRTSEKHKKAATDLRKQIDRWPRTPSGGFWHRDPIYANQMWLDGIYMADTFYATYTSFFEPDNITAWEDIALQFDLIDERTRNTTTNLLVHGYDESKTAIWADPETGAAPNVWDRAVGWYFMALVEVLQVYPKELPGYGRLLEYLTKLADGVKQAQDASGGWWLVMNEPYPGMEGNYIESSGTAMFTYGYLKGIRTGLLEESYRETANKGWDALLDDFIIYEKNGTLTLDGTVRVGSLNSNGTFEYYIGVNVDLNDGKGAGPFMFAATEIEQHAANLTARRF